MQKIVALNPLLVAMAFAVTTTGVWGETALPSSAATEIIVHIDRQFARDQSVEGMEQHITALLQSATAFYAKEDYASAIIIHDDIDRRFGKEKNEKIRAWVLTALGEKVLALIRQKEWKQEEALWESIRQDFGKDTRLLVRARLAEVFFRRAFFSHQGWDWQTAIATANDAAARFGKDKNPAVRQWVAAALYVKGGAINWQKKTSNWYEEEAKVYRDIDARFGKDTDADTRYWVIRALLQLTDNNMMQAGDICREIDRRYGDDASPEIRALVIQALLTLISHAHSGNVDIDAVYADIERRFGNDPSPQVRVMLAQALIQKSKALYEPEAKIAIYDAIVQRFGADDAQEMRTIIFDTLFTYKLRALMGREAQEKNLLAVYDDILQRFGDDPTPDIQAQMVGVRADRNAVLIHLGNITTAAPLLAEIEGLANADEKAREIFADSLRRNALAMIEQDKILEAIAIYAALKTRLGGDRNSTIESSSFALKGQLSYAMGVKTAMLVSAAQSRAEKEFWKNIDQRFAANEFIDELIAEAMYYQGQLLISQPELAINSAKNLIRRFEASKYGVIKSLVKESKELIETLSSGKRPKPNSVLFGD
ncbi:MAG: hypothetical protein LBQ81_07075 [Zoogloeaceae bacterium]|nr:hypothetical protein [Zoogloeaceae bacterium]